MVTYLYLLYVEDGETLAAQFETDSPLPDLQAGNKLYLTTDRIGDVYIIDRVKVTLSHLSGKLVRYQGAVFCDLRSD